MKSSSGCWTCRLRRKKCDEERPVCGTCAALYITCHYSQDKPEWMDGGLQQEEMSQQLKREVKANAHQRRSNPSTRVSHARTATSEENVAESSKGFAYAESKIPGDNDSGLDQFTNLRLRDAQKGTPNNDFTKYSTTLGWSDTILLSFYFEHVFPFLFPFYNPCPLQGGRAWILRLASSSPVVRQGMLCQSSYFLSLSQGLMSGDPLWVNVLKQTREAFEVLRQALQVIQGSDVSVHLQGTVRILASIVQISRFEITVLSFDNWQAHLSAALALFKQLLNVPGTPDPAFSFKLLLDLLENSSGKAIAQCPFMPSAEQVALRFSSSLLMLDDIIASTALQERPVLYEYHHSLLDTVNDDMEPAINFEDVLGCQNWVLIQVGEIAVLDSWKQKCIRAGQFDSIELVRRAATIKDLLDSNHAEVVLHQHDSPKKVAGLQDVLTHYPHQNCSVGHDPPTTLIWAHAAYIYLSIVVCGWQPNEKNVRDHVDAIIALITDRISPPEMLRTMVWPFCVAGCLAIPSQEDRFRRMIHDLHPASVFGTLRQALGIMEKVWKNGNEADYAVRDLAACFKSQGDLVLLV